MNNYVTGPAIRALREKKGMTQRELAEALSVSDKAVSKWETGRGLPDISLLEPLAATLGVSLTELLSGETVTNSNRSANMLRGKWFVCPVCGNVIRAAGESVISCCGLRLSPETAEQPDEAHEITVRRIDDEYVVSLEHPMTKTHSIRFIAYVTDERVELVRLYAEQNATASFFMRSNGRIYAYCNHHGLFELRV